MRYLRSGAPALGLAFVLLVMTSCSGDSPTTPPAAVAGSLTAVAGDGQSGVVGAALGTDLTVVVKDTNGEVMAGVAVAWSVTSGGGSVSQASTTSGSDGSAAVTWTLGGAAGTQSVTATVSTFTVTFSATAAAGPAAQVTVTAASTTLEALEATVKLSASVSDQFGNPVSGAGDATWASADTTVIAVGADGTATAVANGAADVTATVGSLSGKATLTVAQKATSVSVAPANPVTSIGGTVQLSASSEDANGFAVTGGTFAWTSSDAAVATVDSTGLVTGAAEGIATITAASGGVSGAATLTVAAAPFEPTADTEVSGTLNVAQVTIPAGVTVTLTADAVISAAGDVTIAGTVTGDCVAAAISAGGDLTVTGTVTNTCSSVTDAPPGLTIQVTSGTLTLDGATLTSSGSVTVGDGSDGPAAAAPRPVDGPRRAEGAASCSLSGGTMKSGAAPAGGNGQWPQPPELTVACGAGISLTGTTFIIADGRDGADASGAGEVKAGRGEDAGSLWLKTDATVSFSAQEGPVRVFLGSGGRGGHASATGNAPVALGGRGGNAGNFFVSAEAEEIGAGALELYLGSGGDGGGAEAIATDGADATSLSPAGKGGDASATAGGGGDHPELPEQDGYDTNVPQVGRPGHGGKAIARGGNGGAGSEEFPDGGQGGSVTSWGGDSGDTRDGTEQITFPESANGGDAVFMGGNGGSGFGTCSPAFPRGGDGGTPGDVQGGPGESRHSGAVGLAVFDDVANGGPGGDGLEEGLGAYEGDDNLRNVTPENTRELSPSFRSGLDGERCPQIAGLDVTVLVKDDPAGHEPFVRMAATVTRITLALLGIPSSVEGPQPAGGAGTVTITGDGNWITVSGSVAADGTFTLTGAGDAAGFSNVSTSFAGTLTRDDAGTITGVSGTLTVGTNGELYGTPVSYTVSSGG